MRQNCVGKITHDQQPPSWVLSPKQPLEVDAYRNGYRHSSTEEADLP
jgi:hypothetical protein